MLIRPLFLIGMPIVYYNNITILVKIQRIKRTSNKLNE